MVNMPPPGPLRILIVKLSSLGDIVHALPAAATLRANLPQARLAWVVERKWLPLVAGHPALDEVFTVDTGALRRRPRSWDAWRDDLARLRAFHPDCAFDLQGTLKSAWITHRSGAPERWGFARAALRERWAGLAYNHRVQPHSVHIVDQMLDVVTALTPNSAQRVLEFPVPVPPAVQQEVDAWLADNALRDFAFFSPGGGWASKRWPSERYGRLAEILEQSYGLAAVLNRGPGDKDDAYRRANAIRARLFSGDVEHLAAVLKRARLAVGGDTGPLQLAAALGVPTVALFGPTDPARNGPYSPLCRVIRKTTFTTYQRSSTYSPAMMAIQPEEVAAVCGELLDAAVA
jgi:lipopolysaccharide heptosyltransferase I